MPWWQKLAAGENRVGRQHPEMYKITKERASVVCCQAHLALCKGEPNHSTILNAFRPPGGLEMQ